MPFRKKKESNKKRKEKVLHAKYLKPLRAKGGGRFWGLEKLRLIVNGPAMDDTL